LEHTSIKRSHGSQTVDDNLNDDRKTWEAFFKATKRSTPEGTEKVKCERKKERTWGWSQGRRKCFKEVNKQNLEANLSMVFNLCNLEVLSNSVPICLINKLDNLCCLR
jgi:hypothetical protein